MFLSVLCALDNQHEKWQNALRTSNISVKMAYKNKRVNKGRVVDGNSDSIWMKKKDKRDKSKSSQFKLIQVRYELIDKQKIKNNNRRVHTLLTKTQAHTHTLTLMRGRNVLK